MKRKITSTGRTLEKIKRPPSRSTQAEETYDSDVDDTLCQSPTPMSKLPHHGSTPTSAQEGRLILPPPQVDQTCPPAANFTGSSGLSGSDATLSIPSIDPDDVAPHFQLRYLNPKHLLFNKKSASEHSATAADSVEKWACKIQKRMIEEHVASISNVQTHLKKMFRKRFQEYAVHENRQRQALRAATSSSLSQLEWIPPLEVFMPGITCRRGQPF